MPLKKYNTASSILMPSTVYNPAHISQETNIKPSSSSSSPKSCSSSCSSPRETSESQNFKSLMEQNNIGTESSITDQMKSLTKLMPSIIEAASVTAKEAQNNQSLQSDGSKRVALPVEIKTRLHIIFSQIEHEFDCLYAENVRLQQELTKNNVKSPNIALKTLRSFDNTSSSSTLVATQNLKNSNSSPKLELEKSLSHPPSVSNTHVSNIIASKVSDKQNLTGSTSNSKSMTGFSKTRINNLSFPKFRPNAREFIMQSIKNTSAQIVNKTQSNNSAINSKLQSTLSGHKDGIWDINCLPIPNHLINNNNSNFGSLANNNNLLIGTASADTTARLWYLNSHSNSATQNQLSPIPSSQNQQYCNNNLQTNGFCIQQYCGHTGSVNSVRFHPRFFKDATNLILTGSGDCQAHIWQCVLSPVNDSLESTSDVVLNYNNCYSIAMKQALLNSNHNLGNNQSGLSSPPLSNQHINTPSNLIKSPSSSFANYQDLITNTPIIRSPIKRFEGHSDVCIAAEWFPDGDLLATASWDRSANVYNVETAKILCSVQHDDVLTNVNIHPTQKIILTSSKDTTFKVWDFRDPICSVNVYKGHNRSVNSAIFVSEDKIATSSDDHTVKFWDLRIMRSPVSTINVNSGVNRICTMTANSDPSTNQNETYLCLPLDNRDIKIYNLQGERVLRMPRTNRIGHSRLVTSLASYNNLLLSASFDKFINCWSLDYSPPKSGFSSNSLKFNFSNKENNSQLTENQANTPLSQNGLIPTEQNSMSSCSFQKNYDSSPTQNKTSTSNYGLTSISPVPVLQSLAHITNSSSVSGNNNTTSTTKVINPLSKLADKIKI